MHAGQHITASIKLVRKFDEGGMGHLWIAEHVALNTEVAVKFMAPGYADNATLSQRFTQEAQSAAKLQSPHVARVFDHGVTPEGEPFIVMELLSGETLRKRISRAGPMPLDEAQRLVEQTATALDAAHKLGIVHRDIKPENLFLIDVGGKPFVKVLDFGIAKQLRADPKLTATSAVLGSPGYMSPERFTDTKKVDHRADLWALGVVTYEVLTSKPPFRGKTVWAQAEAVQKGKFRPICEARPDLPKAVDEWMNKALATEPDARFGGAIDMAEALASACKRISIVPPSSRDAIANAPTEPGLPPPSGGRIGSPGDRAQGRLDPPQLDSERPAVSKAPASDESQIKIIDRPGLGCWSLTLPGGWPYVLTFDDAGKLLFAASGVGSAFCVDLAKRQVRWLRQTQSRAVSIASGGQWVAIGNGAGRIHLLDAARGTIERTHKIYDRAVAVAAISRGGLHLAASCRDKTMGLWRTATGEPLRAATYLHFLGIQALTFSGGNALLASGALDGTARLWDTLLQPRGILQKERSSVTALAFSPDDTLLAVGSDDGNLRLWTTATGEPKKTLSGDRTPILSVGFARASGLLIAVRSSGEIQTWQGLTDQPRRVFLGSGSPVGAAAISRDGRYVATASQASKEVNVYLMRPSAASV
jgi:serine/threonine protein kinase